MPTLIARNLKTLKKTLQVQDLKNKKIGLVPTMGSIHKGHLSLVNKSLRISEVTVVSIFVNPLQFDKVEDLKNYPIDYDKDIQILTEKVDLIFFSRYERNVYRRFQYLYKFKKYSNILCGKEEKDTSFWRCNSSIKIIFFSRSKPRLFRRKRLSTISNYKKLVKDLNLDIKIFRLEQLETKRALLYLLGTSS